MSAEQLRGLAGVRRTGIPVDDLESEADELGWRCVVLDGAEAEDKAGFLQVCADAFRLPEWFGMNWDALEECLGDLDLGAADGVVVLWVSWGEFAEAEPREFAVAVDVLAGAVRSWKRDGVRGGVLLVGEGPETDLDLDEL